jgi:hypothetical protein
MLQFKSTSFYNLKKGKKYIFEYNNNIFSAIFISYDEKSVYCKITHDVCVLDRLNIKSNVTIKRHWLSSYYNNIKQLSLLLSMSTIMFNPFKKYNPYLFFISFITYSSSSYYELLCKNIDLHDFFSELWPIIMTDLTDLYVDSHIIRCITPFFYLLIHYIDTQYSITEVYSCNNIYELIPQKNNIIEKMERNVYDKIMNTIVGHNL